MSCDECDRLLREYERAVFSHERVMNRLTIASFLNDPSATASFRAELNASADLKEKAQSALRSHKCDIHSESDAAGGSPPPSSGQNQQ
jgi:hypothetical protein